jgi:peptidase M28-like protein
MKPRGTTLLVSATLGLVALLTVARTLPPAPLPAAAPATAFSAERALEHIRAIAREPHPTGSAANAKVRAYILGVLNDLGLATETQAGGDLVNILARLPGARSTNAVLLTAHYDSVAEAPGASDDGNGVAALLETARALASSGPFPNTIMFLFTDNEEGGTVGAGAFIADHPWAQDAKVVIGLDAGGLTGPGVLSATSPENGWLIRQLAQADTSVVGSSAINALASSGTDFGSRFNPAGFSGYAFDLYWDRRIHTPADNLDNLDLASLQHQGQHALSLARHFAGLEELTDPREADAVYFSVMRLGVLAYPVTWAFPLAVLVSGFFSGVLIFGLRKGILTWKGMGCGVLMLLVSFLIAPLPTILFSSWSSDLPFRFIGRAVDRPPQVAAIFLCTLALLLFWYWIARKLWLNNIADLTVGALFPLTAGLIGTAVVLPELSFIPTCPLVLTLLACANWFYREAHGQSSATVTVGLLISGAASIVVLGPTIILGLFDQMALTSLLVAALCGFLAPQIYVMLGASNALFFSRSLGPQPSRDIGQQ